MAFAQAKTPFLKSTPITTRAILRYVSVTQVVLEFLGFGDIYTSKRQRHGRAPESESQSISFRIHRTVREEHLKLHMKKACLATGPEPSQSPAKYGMVKELCWFHLGFATYNFIVSTCRLATCAESLDYTSSLGASSTSSSSISSLSPSITPTLASTFPTSTGNILSLSLLSRSARRTDSRRSRSNSRSSNSI